MPQKAPVFSVYQINGYIKGLLDDDVLLAGFFVEGELSNVKESRGHLYFTLKDERAQTDAVMFAGNAECLRFEPRNGMSVLVFGRVSMYEKTGRCQIYAETMEPSGVGGLYAAFLRLKEKLLNEGLFAPERKKPIPPRPKLIAVVTSPTGAVIQDIINVARRRDKGVGLVIAPVQVQGRTAADEIAGAIADINAWGGADVIIIARGGGSIEDLQAFNEEIVARAVAASAIPVVSAVGHETDYTICDFAADMRAPTPSAAAELCVPLASDLERGIKILRSELDGAIDELIALRRAGLDMNKSALDYAVTEKIKALSSGLAKSAAMLEALSPLRVLSRGYAVLYMGGEPVTNVSDVKERIAGGENDAVIRLRDGLVYGTISGADGAGAGTATHTH